MKHYVLDENNNKVESYSAEEILTILNQAIKDGTLENIDKNSGVVDTLKCSVNGVGVKVAFITQAQYNELVAKELLELNTYYFITDDETCVDIYKDLEEFYTNFNHKIDLLGTSTDRRIQNLEDMVLYRHNIVLRNKETYLSYGNDGSFVISFSIINYSSIKFQKEDLKNILKEYYISASGYCSFMDGSSNKYTYPVVGIKKSSDLFKVLSSLREEPYSYTDSSLILEDNVEAIL